MLPALIIFLLTYLLMLALPQYRPFAALGGAALFLALGAAGLWDFTLMDAARAVDFNVLLMMAGTMGTVSLFIESRMPARLAELLIVRAIWGDTDCGSTKKLQVNMANIRKKLGSVPGRNTYILNELGVGYRMIDEDTDARPES